MLPHRNVLFLAAFVIAQAWIPQQKACDGRKPAPSPDPADNLAIVEQFVTGDGVRLGVQIVASNLDVPWSLAFAPDGRLFFTERPGRVRVMVNGQVLEQPALTLSDVVFIGEAGLLGLALDPAFASNRFVYLAYTGFDSGGFAVNRVVRYRETNNTLGERAVIIDNITASSGHDGGRLRFGPDGKLYYTMGEATAPDLAQQLSRLSGKILRLNADGTTPADNPFGSPVWTWGHRNPQGIDWHPLTGEAWATEHGQSGNDELNRLQRGANYGWPVIEGDQTFPGMERPALLFAATIAPSGMSFYRASRIPRFRDNIFIGALRGMHIHRVVLQAGDPTRVASSERLLEGRFGRIRDVITGPDGALYFSTTNRDDRERPAGDGDKIARIIPVQ